MTSDLKTELLNKEIDPIRISQRVIDNLMEKTSPYLQSLMYVKNLEPEQLECIYKTKLYITKTYADIHNIAELFSANDAVSSVRFACYNIEHFLKASTKLLLKMFCEQDIKINYSCADDCKSAYIDIRRTSLILFNLISNSVIHTKNKNKKITISTFRRGDDFVMSVKDNGQGISSNIQKTLFTVSTSPLSPKLIDKTGGGLILTGVGLTISRRAATEMGGTLTHIPTKSGALFELTIPQTKHHLSFGEVINYEPTQQECELYLAGALLSLS